MEVAYVSALAGLTGAAVGGLTSFATSWITQRTQLSDRNRRAEWRNREQFFAAFIMEACKRYGDALGHQRDSVEDMVRLYALLSRIRLIASREVVIQAEKTVDTILRAYLGPNLTLRELSTLIDSGALHVISEFSEACRFELEALGPGGKGRSSSSQAKVTNPRVDAVTVQRGD
jgi:hypothetical protein